MKRNIIYSIIAFLLCSCGTGKHLPVQTEQRDSVRIEVRKETKYIKDTVFLTVPAQSAENTTRDTSSHLETDYAESDARINPDGTLYHSLRNKEQEKPIPVMVPLIQKDSLMSRYRDRLVYRRVEVPRELTGWQNWQMRSFWILLSAVAIYVFRKPLLNLIRRFI